MTKKKVTKEKLNAAFEKAAKTSLKGILEYTDDPIVSSDVVGQPCSSLIDGQATMVISDNMVKVISWYDNEWGYSNRVVELMKAAHKLKAPAKKAAKAAAKKKPAKKKPAKKKAARKAGPR